MTRSNRTRRRLLKGAMALPAAASGMAGNTRTGSFSQITLALNDRIALHTPLFAGPVDGAGNAPLSIEVQLPPAPSGFEVVLPDLQLGAQRIAIPPMRFDRRTFDDGLEPFNC